MARLVVRRSHRRLAIVLIDLCALLMGFLQLTYVRHMIDGEKNITSLLVLIKRLKEMLIQSESSEF